MSKYLMHVEETVSVALSDLINAGGPEGVNDLLDGLTSGQDEAGPLSDVSYQIVGFDGANTLRLHVHGTRERDPDEVDRNIEATLDAAKRLVDFHRDLLGDGEGSEQLRDLAAALDKLGH